jgi:GNAT superfamily N-acetyltransferase
MVVHMVETALDKYVDAFARSAGVAAPGDAVIDQPGLAGVWRADSDKLRLLVTDDRALEQLGQLVGSARGGVITVLPEAVQAVQLLREERQWSDKPVNAMLCHDLATVPSVALPQDLVLLDVAVEPGGDPQRVDLAAATEVAIKAAPTDGTPAQLAAYLREMRPAPHLFAAVDALEIVRATGGFRVSGADANVLFVNTQRPWRRRGIGRAMTATALQRARRAGAVQACLDASEAGASIYRSLGFVTAGLVTQFFTH